jgi:hypothetical protein
MANFSPSNLVKAQARLQQRFTEAEMRQKQLPALRMALSNQGVLIPGAEQLRTREDRSVEAYVLGRSKRATTSSRVYNHTGSRGDSFAVPLSWTTYTDKFSISLKQMDNNIFAFEETLAQQILNCVLNIQASIETDRISYLLAQRSQVNNGTAGGSFNATNYAFEIADADKARYYAIVRAMMAQNFYQGSMDVIVDPLTYINAGFFAAQGAGNATNTAYQFMDFNIAQSTDLTDANYPGGVSLVMPAGGYACLPWIPKQNRIGTGDYNSYLGGYGSMMDPTGLPIEYAIHGYAQRADTSSLNGNTQDDVLEFEMSVDIADVLSPLSGGLNESVVFEVGQLQ